MRTLPVMVQGLPDFLSITRAHVEEVRSAHPDIIAACVGGSVARGDPLPVSDIDVRLVTTGWIEPPVPFREVDAWRDGVHIDAQLVPRAFLSRLEGYLDHPYIPGFFRHGSVVMDTEEFLADLQTRLNEQFMRPEWVTLRMAGRLGDVERHMELLPGHITADDPVGTARSTSVLLRGLTLLPLLAYGANPCGLRRLGQINRISPDLRERLISIEGVTAADPEELPRVIEMLEPPFAGDANGRAAHAFAQTHWMARNGLHDEARHVIFSVLPLAMDRLDDASRPADAAALARGVLKGLGWADRGPLQDKLRSLRALRGAVDRCLEQARSTWSQPPRG